MRMRDPFARVSPGLKIRNEGKEAEVLLYDEIGFFGIQAKEFVEQLNGIAAETINLRINSPGGSVFEGLTMANALQRHKARVIVHVDGLAASIASVIAMSADEVRMAKNAYLMIHDPWGIVVGGADDMRKEAELLDKVGGTIVQAYVDKTGKTPGEIAQLMRDETWFTAEEAEEIGLADVVEESKQVEDKFDLSVFNKVPAALNGGGNELNPRALEAALRDAGCSRKDAKAIVAKGLSGLRDAEPDQRDADDRERLNEIAAQYLGHFKA